MQQHEVELLVDGHSAVLFFAATHWELALKAAVSLLQHNTNDIEVLSVKTMEDTHD